MHSHMQGAVVVKRSWWMAKKSWCAWLQAAARVRIIDSCLACGEAAIIADTLADLKMYTGFDGAGF